MVDYIRQVTTGAALNPPTNVLTDQSLTATITDNSATWASPSEVTFHVEDADASVEFYDGSSWTGTAIPHTQGWHSYPVAAKGIRAKNRTGATAKITVVRMSA